MEGLAHFHENIVGDVHDVIDGTQAHRFQLPHQPGRAGRNLDAPDAAGGVERTTGRVVEADFARGSSLLPDAGVRVVPQALHRQFRQGRQFPCHAEMRQQIRAVGGDFHFQHGVHFQILVDGRAHRSIGRQQHQAVRIIAESDLAARAHHALTETAPELAFLDLKTTRQHRSGQSDRHLVPFRKILRPAHNLPRRAGAIIHLTKPQAVGIGMRHERNDLPHDQTIGAHPALGDSLDLDPGKSQEIGKLGGGMGGKIKVIGEPVEGDFHGIGLGKGVLTGHGWHG